MAKGTNNSPRISVNKLAEFIGAKAVRQRAILRDQKYPTDYKGMYHREAAEAISSCISSSGEDTAVLDRAIARLEQLHSDSIGTQRRIAANIDAVETFRLMLDDVFPLLGSPSLGENSPSKLTVHNVAISVRPDIILRSNGRAGGQLLGGIKLHFPKTFPLNIESAATVSAVVQDWFKATMPDDGTVSGPMCYVIDVGSKSVFKGSKSIVARLKEVKANCENIQALWPTIKPAE